MNITATQGSLPSTVLSFISTTTVVSVQTTEKQTEAPDDNITQSLQHDPEVCDGCVTVTCFYTIVNIVFVISLFANAFVFGRVIADHRLHSETFTAIACLAFGDFFFLGFNIVRLLDKFIEHMYCSEGFGVMDSAVWMTLQGITWFSASFHIALIAVLRFFILVFPFKIKSFMSPKKVVLISCSIWMAGCVLFTGFQIARDLQGIGAKPDIRMEAAVWGTVFALPLLITVCAHLTKLYIVKIDISDFNNPAESKQLSQMAKIILIIIILTTVLPIPRFVCHVLNHFQVKYPSASFEEHLKSVSEILFLLTFSTNPFIYAFMSDTFRKSIKRLGRRTALAFSDASISTVPSVR